MFKKMLIALLVVSSMVAMAACNKEDEKKDDATTTAADAAATTAADAATTEKKEEATTEKVTEATTPKETEPPKEYNYEVVWALDFSKFEDGAEVPFSFNNVVDPVIEGGKLVATSNGGDPFCTYKTPEGEEFSVDTSKVNCIRIKFFNHTEAYEGQMFYSLDGEGFNEPDSTKIYWEYEASMDDNQVQVYEFDPNEDMNGGAWTGNLTNWRLDPFAVEGDFEIYSVEFCTKTEK